MYIYTCIYVFVCVYRELGEYFKGLRIPNILMCYHISYCLTKISLQNSLGYACVSN
jgi:hypothetical protein